MARYYEHHFDDESITYPEYLDLFGQNNIIDIGETKSLILHIKIVNLEMKPLKMKATVKPPGTAREDWQIFAEIGKKIGASGFKFKKVDKVWAELSRFTRNIKTGGQWRRASWKPASKEKHDWYPRYRGATLAERIQDLATFIDALPDRDRPAIDESLGELVKRLEKEQAKEASK